MAEPGLPPGDRALGTPARSGDVQSSALSSFSTTLGSGGVDSLTGVRSTADIGLPSFSPAVSGTSVSLGSLSLTGSEPSTAALSGLMMPGAPSSSVSGIAGFNSGGFPPVDLAGPSLPTVSALSGPSAGFGLSPVPAAASNPEAKSASPELKHASAVSRSTAAQLPDQAATQGVSHGHVPLIPVSTNVPVMPNLSGVGTSPMPSFGASPVPPMTSSSASMMGMAPPAASSVGTHQVPHALVAPLPYGTAEAVDAQDAPDAVSLQPMEPSKPSAPLQHWFYCKSGEPWTPFSLADSSRLESAYQACASGGSSATDLVPTDGGRYDVDLASRLRHPVYWEEEASEVRRCMWFFKDERSGLFSPYSESLSDRLESEYQQGTKYNVWQRKIELPGGQRVVMHSAQMIVDYAPSSTTNTSVQQLAGVVEQHPRVVQRGLDETDELEDGESLDISQLVFVVDGVSSSDTQRSVIAHVDDFRQSAQCMLYEHFPHRAGQRVEFLPIKWSSSLRGDELAVEKELADISLPNCARLRTYTNSTMVDALFYTSPAYCQSILSSVANEMERVLELFQSRHANFSGDVSVVGHSLGACILFDLLSHQGSADPKLCMLSPSSSRPSLQAASSSSRGSFSEETEEVDGEIVKPPALEVNKVLRKFELESFEEKFKTEQIDFDSFKMLSGDEMKELGIPMGPRKKLMTFLREHTQAEEAYQRHVQSVKSRKEIAKAARREAERVRSEQAEADAQREAEQRAAGLQSFTYRKSDSGVGQVFVDYPQLSFLLRGFFAVGSPIAMFLTLRGVQLGSTFHLPTCPNFFNVFHPYDPVAYRVEPMIDASLKLPPVQVPHHKGRKRLHLELRENLGRVGAQLKKNFMESVRQTWQAVQEFAASHYTEPGAASSAEEMAQLERDRLQVEEEFAKQQELASPSEEFDYQIVNAPPIGILNNGQRIDYVLQERPFESFNEYMFSIQSHSSYWSSEDTSLLILRELFTGESMPGTPGDQNPLAFR